MFFSPNTLMKKLGLLDIFEEMENPSKG